jgi:hypothetical protein
MIRFSNTGDFSKTLKFLGTASKGIKIGDLSKYGQEGVDALSRSTPVDSGNTANSWYYKITTEKGKTIISWCNSNIVNGAPIAVMLQYGHATKNGGWVQGRDYINPAICPIFDKMADLAWKEVNKI